MINASSKQITTHCLRKDQHIAWGNNNTSSEERSTHRMRKNQHIASGKINTSPKKKSTHRLEKDQHIAWGKINTSSEGRSTHSVKKDQHIVWRKRIIRKRKGFVEQSDENIISADTKNCQLFEMVLKFSIVHWYELLTAWLPSASRMRLLVAEVYSTAWLL